MTTHFFPERESKQLEFKSKLPDFKSLVKTSVAFANGVGGRIIIGVDDKTRKVIGAAPKDRDRCFEDFPNSLFDSVSPNLIPQVFEQSIGEETVVVIQIWPGMRKPYMIKSEGMPKGVYLRVGSATRRADQEYIEDLFRERRRISYDEEASGLGREALSDRLLARFFGKQISDRRQLSEKVLTQSSSDAGKLTPTYGGILMFSESPEDAIPEALVMCTHFKGVIGRDIIQSRELTGPIPSLAESCLNLLIQWLEKDYALVKSRLKGHLPLPEAALREAVLNALIHRKYTIPGATKIALYDDRLEIFNPGGFPGLVNVSNLGDGTTFLRNHVVANIARKMRLVEKIGSGIRLIFESCKAAGLRKPRYNEDGDFVKLTFLLEASTDAEPTEIEEIEGLAKLKGRLKIREVMDSLNISRNTATRRLNRLIDRGKLRRYGKGPGVYYMLVEGQD